MVVNRVIKEFLKPGKVKLAEGEVYLIIRPQTPAKWGMDQWRSSSHEISEMHLVAYVAQTCPSFKYHVWSTLPNVYPRCPMHFSTAQCILRVNNKKGSSTTFFIASESIGQRENTLGSAVPSIGQCFQNTLGSVEQKYVGQRSAKHLGQWGLNCSVM